MTPSTTTTTTKTTTTLAPADEPPADLLLLNASNYPRVPLFPYAFVQLSEIARRFGLRLAVHDLLGTPAELLPAELDRLLARHRPRMVGLHLRQTDSLFAEDYRGHLPRDPNAPPYHPVAATERVIALLRARTDAPVVLGGHGFTSGSAGLFARMKPDLAVAGEPDGMFARFSDVLARRDLARVPNLVYWDGARAVANPREFFPPAAGTEWTDALVDEARRFYGATLLHAQTMPVEVMRGCPYRCYFCCEPGVKGRTARVRELDAVMADVEFLASRGLRRVWLVCSELNVFGPELALALAERMIQLRERTGFDVRWHAFSLPVRMGEAVWRTLARAGFRGGFNTFVSLDDENLRRARVPHRAVDAAREYRDIETVARELGPAGEDLRARGTLALFLGNAYATPATVARTLRTLDAHGLLETARVPGAMPATRVFESLPAADAARARNPLVAFSPEGPREGTAGGGDAGDLTWPTFEYARALVEHFGTRRELETFFAWVESTALSRLHERDKDYALFLANATTPERLGAWLLPLRGALAAGAAGVLPPAQREALTSLLPACGDPQAVRAALFLPPAHARAAHGALAHALLRALFAHHRDATAAVLARWGLAAADASPDAALAMPIYPLLAALYARFERTAQLVDDAVGAFGPDSLEALFARYFVYARNIVLDPRYRDALFEGPT